MLRARRSASLVVFASAMHCGNTRCGDSRALGPSANNPDVGDAAPEAAPDAVAYNPCPPKGVACRIMPLGDSITSGIASTTGGGYRAPLFQMALDAHQTITFVGSLSSGPAMVGGVAFPPNSEGHSGHTIDGPSNSLVRWLRGGRPGILPLTPVAIRTYKPHIVTLMIGTNDVETQLDLPTAPSRLATLIDAILAADPNLLLVVAQITPTESDAENALVAAYNAAIPALVSARVQQRKHILLADMYGAFTANANYKTAYLANNLHPNDAGFVVMATVWYAAIGALLR
jgi:hypothetical protein